MAFDLDRVREELRTDGWSLAEEVGFTDGKYVDSALLRSICGTLGRPSSRDGDRVVWPVQPRSASSSATFSMRNGVAELHTDAAYRATPERWVALFCVRPADEGGLSTVLTADAAIRGLDDVLRADLGRPIWRWRPPAVFGGETTAPHAVLGASGKIRWRHDTLDVPASSARVAECFRAHLVVHPAMLRIALRADSVLFVDNHRTLHGRTSFTDPRRLLLRVRMAER